MRNDKQPKIHFEKFRDNWTILPMGKIAEITMGQSPDGATYSDTPKGFILVQGNADIENGLVKPKVWTTQKTKTADAGDLLITVRAPAGSMGKTNYPVVIGRGVAAIKGDEFLFQYLQKVYQDGYWSRVSAGSIFESINGKDLRELEIWMPSREEREEIGNYLKNIDSMIAYQRLKVIKLQNAKKSLLQKMFPEGNNEKPSLRFKGITDAWEQHKLKELGTTYPGLFGKNSSNFGHGDAWFVPYLNIFNNPITDLNFLEKTEIDSRQSEVKKGDIFFTTSSETPDEVGMSSVWTGTDSCVYLNSFCFGFRPKIKLDNNYIAFLLRSQSMRNKIVFLAQGISRYNISKNKMMDIEVPLPLTDEQFKIGALLKDLDSLITLHQRKYEKLQNIKKSLLERMFI